MSANNSRYLLITPARNEEEFIELTLKSVVAQTAKPVRWLIVSDGSTDRTDEIVKRYAREHKWIELLRTDERQTRDFGGKANCFNTGYSRLKSLPHEFVGSLDADISFDEDHFAFLLQKFAEDSELGVAGTPFSEGGDTYDYRFSSTDHVSGACQVFRRECLEEIGGYTPVTGGGIDVIAVLSARYHGWRTRTFPERFYLHHRAMGSANHRRKFVASFKFGQKCYRLGNHPVWQIFRSIYQMTRKPYLIGGVADFLGYFWAMLRGDKRPMNQELIEFQQRDQLRRLKTFLMRSGRSDDFSKRNDKHGHIPQGI